MFGEVVAASLNATSYGMTWFIEMVQSAFARSQSAFADLELSLLAIDPPATVTKLNTNIYDQ